MFSILVNLCVRVGGDSEAILWLSLQLIIVYEAELGSEREIE